MLTNYSVAAVTLYLGSWKMPSNRFQSEGVLAELLKEERPFRPPVFLHQTGACQEPLTSTPRPRLTRRPSGRRRPAATLVQAVDAGAGLEASPMPSGLSAAS